MAAAPVQTLNFYGVLSESKRIINAHSRHFLALSVLFLLPLSFSFIIYPTLQSSISPSNAVNSKLFLRYPSVNPIPQSLLIHFLQTLFLCFFSISAIATITYSTFHGFYGRPVKLISAIKSLLYSFIPLISTTLISQLLILSICLFFAVFLLFVTKSIEFLGFEIDYTSSAFLGFITAGLVGLGLVLVYLQVNWALACVIVVVESKWGVEPLWRSSKLIKGMKLVSLSLLLYYSFLIGVSVWVNSAWVANINGWKSWAFVLQTVFGTAALTIFLLHSVAANTVLYMYCKALHGELASDIAEEFMNDYLSLPFDADKHPQVVSVIVA